MRNFDVLVKTDIGEISSTLQAEDDIPTGLLLQAVMSHQQLLPHFVAIGANQASVLAAVTPGRLQLPPGLTVVFADGVNINGPLKPSPIPNVPEQFGGRTLTHGLTSLVVYKRDPAATESDDDEWSEDTH